MTTIPTPLWMQAVTGETAPQYNAQTDRSLIDAMYASQGVIGAFMLGSSGGGAGSGSLAVSQRAAGANMTVDVAQGACVITGTNATGQGKYLCPEPSGVVNVGPLTSSPPAGQERWDAIIAKVTDAQNVGGTTSDWTPTFVTGTVAGVGSATKPATPASALLLAYVYVGPTVAQITNANIYDQRTAAVPTMALFGSQALGSGFSAGSYAGQPVLVQVGQASGTTTSQGILPFTFPKPFPNGVLKVVPDSFVSVGFNYFLVFLVLNSVSLTGAQLAFMATLTGASWASYVNAAASCDYIAYGF